MCDVCANGNFLLTSKALSLFENDERFKAVDRPRDREDLFDNYIVELERKVIICGFFFQFGCLIRYFTLLNKSSHGNKY